MTDQLLFMQHGKLIEQGSLKEFKQKYAEPKIRIEFDSSEELHRFKTDVPWSMEQSGTSIGLIDMTVQTVTMTDVLARLSAGSYAVRKVERQSASLEEIFLKVVQ